MDIPGRRVTEFVPIAIRREAELTGVLQSAAYRPA